MQKKLIGAIVGGILLFLWQFLSWTVLNIHGSQTAYTEGETAILEVLSENLTDGEYFVPGVPPGTASDKAQEIQMGNIGKPWATIHYHSAMEASMAMNMIRGLVVNIVIVFFLIWILLNYRELDFKNVFSTTLMVGILAYLANDYLNAVWFQNNTIPELIDAVASYSILGAWLGWWLNR